MDILGATAANNKTAQNGEGNENKKDLRMLIVVYLILAARSPETNVLDLALWWSIQSLVEEKHKNKAMLVDEFVVLVVESRKDQMEEKRGHYHNC